MCQIPEKKVAERLANGKHIVHVRNIPERKALEWKKNDDHMVCI